MALWAGPWTIADLAKRQTAIAIKTMPAQRNFLKRLTSHGLHGIPKERLYLTNLDHHVRLIKNI
jgi:hypothetical protein